MTQYYADADNGNDANDGLGTGAGNAWATIEKFTEAARSAGDILTCRRGMTATYDLSGQMDFTSDGTRVAPIVVEADFDDSWADFANSAQTFTPVFGAKTMTASATITGISVGDWVYNSTDGDDPREFSYEVAAVSGTTLTLHLPWKGSTGATKTLKVMSSSPVWGDTSAHAGYVNFSTDHDWKMQGIQIETTTNQNVFLTNAYFITLKDCVFVGDGSPVADKAFLLSACSFSLLKCRSEVLGQLMVGSGAAVVAHLKDSHFEGLADAGSVGITCDDVSVFKIEECEFTQFEGGILSFPAAGDGVAHMYLRNVILDDVDEVINDTADSAGFVFSEDHDGVVGASKRYYAGVSTTQDTPVVISDTGTVRTGGSNTSLKMTPTTNISTAENGLIKLLDIPIYATTSSKTYDIYFKTAATTDWTADPTAAELWIELEAWGHASNNFRKVTKSTGVIDFNGSTAWQKLTVTVAPGQAGVAYLRVWYGKTKESGKTNIFWIDPKPVIT